jgi:hypothetical protein
MMKILLLWPLVKTTNHLDFFQNQNSEECNYPTSLFGTPRKPSILAKFQYQDIAQWELMHKDHWFARRIPNLFFKAIKVLIQQVKSTSWIKIHKGKLNDRVLRANFFTSKHNLNKLLRFDLRHCNLTHLRMSLDYLSKLWRNAFAMIHQLGPPTFFVTFISAESKWTTLMSTLHTLNKNHMEILKNFDELESKHFIDLVNSDSITCAHYYDHRMVAFHNLLKKDSSIFGKVDDLYFITKF